ncbi:MAG: hypothetical protein INQ03_25015 [Candidatus Heimdallarchaeota archaeon]|nr:hypothetical protein [Candidatus Heimdallarchaeota archaeon]
MEFSIKTFTGDEVAQLYSITKTATSSWQMAFGLYSYQESEFSSFFSSLAIDPNNVLLLYADDKLVGYTILEIFNTIGLSLNFPTNARIYCPVVLTEYIQGINILMDAVVARTKLLNIAECELIAGSLWTDLPIDLDAMGFSLSGRLGVKLFLESFIGYDTDELRRLDARSVDELADFMYDRVYPDVIKSFYTKEVIKKELEDEFNDDPAEYYCNRKDNELQSVFKLKSKGPVSITPFIPLDEKDYDNSLDGLLFLLNQMKSREINEILLGAMFYKDSILTELKKYNISVKLLSRYNLKLDN